MFLLVFIGIFVNLRGVFWPTNFKFSDTCERALESESKRA